MITEYIAKLNGASEKRAALFASAAKSIRRLFPAYLLCFLPFAIFGTKNDIRLMLWKVAVVGAGLLVFHFTRKAMFPYIDLNRSLHLIRQPGDGAHFMGNAAALLAEALIIAAMAFAIIIAMAEGL